MQRDWRLDFLRGIAVLLVIVLHAAVLSPGAEQYPLIVSLLSRGSVGMQLFFVLSGVLVYRSWLRAAQFSRPYRQYWVMRLTRLYPLYLIFLALNIEVWLVFSFLLNDPEPLRNFVSADTLTAGNILAHLLFLQGLIPGALHTLVDGSWSIVNEMYFYLLLPILAARLKTTRKWVWAYFGALALAVVTSWLIGRSAFNVGYFNYYNFLAQLPCFVLGVLVARLLDSPAVCAFCRAHWDVLLAIAATAALAALRDDLRPVGYHHVYAAVFALILLVVCNRLPSSQPARLPGVIARLGEQSYSIFFLHILLLKIAGYVEETYQIAGDGFAAAFTLNLLVGVFGSYALSTLIFHRMDRYATDLARRWTSRSGVARPKANLET